MTYSLRINFRDGRTYTREGLSREQAIGLKEYFVLSVPAAVSGSITPESDAENKKGRAK